MFAHVWELREIIDRRVLTLTSWSSTKETVTRRHACAQVSSERAISVVRCLFSFCVESGLFPLILCLIWNLLGSVKYCGVAPRCNL